MYIEMAEVTIADIPDIVPDIPEMVPNTQEIPEIPETEPAAKKRGRPPGAKNKEKPRIIVESLPAPEPEEVEAPTPDPPKRQRKQVVLPEPVQQTPAQAFKAAMHHWNEMQQQELNSKGEHYHKLVSAMFK